MNREEALIDELVFVYDGLDQVCDYVLAHDEEEFCGNHCQANTCLDKECIKKYISLKYGVSFERG